MALSSVDRVADHAESIEVAASEQAFIGVVTIDSSEERIFDCSYESAHGALAVPNTAATRFAIASGSKAFTALAVMRLVEDGAIPLIDGAVTVEHLL